MKSKDFYALFVSLYIVSLAVANILAGIILQLPFNLTIAAGTLVFPITYVASNVISEVWGYNEARFAATTAIVINTLLVLLYTGTLLLPTPVFFQNDEAFRIVLGAVPRIFIASTLASFFASWLNDIVFERLKTNRKGNFSSRVFIASSVGQLANSAIFIPIAFLGRMPISNLMTMYFVTVVVRVAYEIIFLPLTNVVVKNL